MIKFTPRHLSQAMIWISNVICRGLHIFYIQWTKVRGDCSLCWYCWNCLPSLLKLSFHNNNVKPFFYEGAILFFCVCKKPHSHSTNKFSETDIIKMVKFLIDNTFLCLMIHVFFQHTDRSYRYIDDILSLSYSKFDDNIDHIYQITF